eukprot:1160794-Pelagomonas_calceolata.AAC.6
MPSGPCQHFLSKWNEPFSTTVQTPGPRISWRPPSNSTATSVAIFQGPQLKSPSIPFCEVWEGSSTPSHTLEPLKELGLDTHTATKLALKLYAHSVQCAYKLASTRRAITSPLNFHHRNQGIHGASALDHELIDVERHVSITLGTGAVCFGLMSALAMDPPTLVTVPQYDNSSSFETVELSS